MSQTSPRSTFQPGSGAASQPPALSEEELRALALRRLKKKKDFRGHVAIYVVVNLALWAIWVIDGIASGWEFPWPVFPTVIWGLFVLGQANDVYWRRPLTEEVIQKEIDHLRATPGLRRLETETDEDDTPC